MSARGFVPWMAMLTFYFLTVAMLVTFFMVHCGTVSGALLGDNSTATPNPSMPVLIGRTE